MGLTIAKVFHKACHVRRHTRIPNDERGPPARNPNKEEASVNTCKIPPQKLLLLGFAFTGNAGKRADGGSKLTNPSTRPIPPLGHRYSGLNNDKCWL